MSKLGVWYEDDEFTNCIRKRAQCSNALLFPIEKRVHKKKGKRDIRRTPVGLLGRYLVRDIKLKQKNIINGDFVREHYQ